MGMASFPTLWLCRKCRTYITVNPETGSNYRAPNGLVEIWCRGCGKWGQPCEPNGSRRA